LWLTQRRGRDTHITRANSELKKIALWFRANKMAVNIGKTKFIVFHNRGKNVDMNGRKIVYDDNEPLPMTPILLYHLNVTGTTMVTLSHSAELISY
jgi:hypothetical protein